MVSGEPSYQCLGVVVTQTGRLQGYLEDPRIEVKQAVENTIVPMLFQSVSVVWYWDMRKKNAIATELLCEPQDVVASPLASLALHAP